MCTDELSSEIKALLAIDVVQIQWAQPEHAELILSKLAESDSRYAKKARRRRDQQDFEFMTSSFTSEMWDTMLNAEVSADAKTALHHHPHDPHGTAAADRADP